MTNDELRERIEELVSSAWALGMMAGNPNTPSRREVELHAEVWNGLQQLLDELEETP